MRDYVAVLGLELMLDEAEGYALLQSIPEDDDQDSPKRPRLIACRQLSFDWVKNKVADLTGIPSCSS